jgi:hypothetical protein
LEGIKAKDISGAKEEREENVPRAARHSWTKGILGGVAWRPRKFRGGFWKKA